MKLNTLDLIVRDVPAAAAFFRDALGLQLQESGETFAQLQAGDVTIMLSPDALIPVRTAGGVILHFEVADVTEALERARAAGATVLLETTQTPWGWESAIIAGPEEAVIDFYRPLKSG